MRRELSYDDILEIEAKVQAGTFDENQFYQDLAYAQATEASDFKIDGAIGAGVGLLMFALLGWMGAAGAAVLVVARILQKTGRGSEIAAGIESGNVQLIADYLPPLEKQQFLTTRAKAAVAAAECQPVVNGNAVQSIPQPTAVLPTPTSVASPAPVSTPTTAHLHHTVEVVRNSSPVPPAIAPRPPIHQPITTQSTPAQPTTVQPAQPTTAPINKYDTAQKIANMGARSLLWIGGSGTAKSLTATTALKKLKAADPSVQVWCVSAKCDEAESGYWTGFDRYSFYDFLSCSTAQMIAAFNDWSTIIQEFKVYQGKGILLFDELSLMMTYAVKIKGPAAKNFKNDFELFMLGMSSAGRSSGKGVWGISPNGALNALGGLTKAQLGAFMCAFNAQLSDGVIGFNYGVWQDASNNGMAPQRTPSPKEEQAAKDAGCTLLTGFNGQWFPTMRYPLPPRDPRIIQRFVRGQLEISTPTVPQEPALPQDLPRWVVTQPDPATQPDPSDVLPPPTPMSGLQYIENPQSIEQPMTTSSPQFQELVRQEQLLILQCVIEGKSKNESAKVLGVNPGGSAKYLRFSDIYDQYKRLFGNIGRGGLN